MSEKAPDREDSSELDREPLSPVPGHERPPESEPLEPEADEDVEALRRQTLDDVE